MVKSFVCEIIALLMATRLYESKIRLIEPQEYRNSVTDDQGNKGDIDYSVSMFGDIDYLRDDEVEVILPPVTNQFGCEPLSPPKSISTRYAYLFKRGECTFTKKASNARLVS